MGLNVGLMPKLSAVKLKSLLAKPGRHGDGDGLYFRVTKNRTASWIQRIVVYGHRRDLGLGPYPQVGLAEARSKNTKNREIAAHGGNPATAKSASSLPTFEQAAKQFLEANSPTWKTTRYAKGWMSQMTTYVLPAIGHIPIDKVSQSDVLDILNPIWTTKPETARKVKQHLTAIFGVATARAWRPDNPAGYVIDGGLPQARRTVTNHRALPFDKVANALATIDKSNAYPASKLCFRFLVLTAARSGEARAAAWTEVLHREKEWRIPPQRMKTGKQHRVPLSQAAMDVLTQAAEIRDNTGLVFPSFGGKVLSDSTLSKLLRENSIDAVPHGFRSSFRDWASDETNASLECKELALSHAIGSTTQKAYAHSDYFEQRRPLMDAWAEYLTQ